MGEGCKCIQPAAGIPSLLTNLHNSPLSVFDDSVWVWTWWLNSCIILLFLQEILKKSITWVWVHFVTDRRKLLPTSRLVTAVRFILVDFFQDAVWKKYLLDTFPRGHRCSVCVCARQHFVTKSTFFNLLCNVSPLNWVFAKGAALTVLETEAPVFSHRAGTAWEAAVWLFLCCCPELSSPEVASLGRGGVFIPLSSGAFHSEVATTGFQLSGMLAFLLNAALKSVVGRDLMENRQ